MKTTTVQRSGHLVFVTIRSERPRTQGNKKISKSDIEMTAEVLSSPVDDADMDDDHDNLFSELNLDIARLDSEAEAILDSIRNETNEARSADGENSSTQNMSDDGCSGDESSRSHS